MKTRRGLSTIVGAVFFIIAASSTIAYVSYSMNVIDDFSNAMIIKESINDDRNSESFQITDAKITNNKFDLTVHNTGQLPIKLTKFWIENKTDSTWATSKFILDNVISPSDSLGSLGQNLSLIAMDTQAYEITLVSDRGNTETFSFNSVNQQAISIQLDAASKNIANGFSTTLFMTVTNDITTDTTLLNLVPQLSSSGSASSICDSLSSPSSQPALKSGDSVIFKWSCAIAGTATESAIFTASIVNGFPGNTAVATVTINDVLLALESGTSLESLGFTIPAVSNDILMIHQETASTPNGEYQLSSGASDSTGFTVDLDTNDIKFITKNTTSTITIPAGNWNASLTYLSSPLDSAVDIDILNHGMIFHFEENTDPVLNANTGTLCDDEISADIASGGSAPSWSNTGGIFSSGGYSFDGGDYISINIDGQCNAGDNGPNTTAGWFNADPAGSDGRQIIVRAEESNPGNEFYEVVYDKSGLSGTLRFLFDTTDSGSSIVECTETNIQTGNWQHFIAVREDRDTCTLYVNGTSIDTQTNTSSTNPQLDINGNWFIGANPNTSGVVSEYFDGFIDSIMHWDAIALDSTEASALHSTKYGVGAHVVNYSIESVDVLGVKTTLDSQTNVDIGFIDPVQDLTNFASSYNMTSALPQVSLTNERLLFTINFVSGLNIDLRIDDETLSNPMTSYIQIPLPNTSFPGYFQYDISNGNYIVKVSNTGDTGAFFSVGGIRGVFDDTSSNLAYGSVVRYVNGTGASSELSDDQDSLYLPPDSHMNIEFYPPSTHPSSTSLGTPITSGDQYTFSIFLSGYDANGRTFFKTIDIGGTQVVD